MAVTKSDAKPRGFDDLIATTESARAHVRALVRAGRRRDAEPDQNRLRAFNTRRARKRAIRGAEAIVGDTEDFQGASYLTEGAQLRRAVAYVEVNDVHSSTAGSGFLISPRLFITNCHVIGDVKAARAAQITFDREITADGLPNATTTFLLDPDTFALFSTEKQLDYAIIAIGRVNSGNTVLADLGFCPLSDSPDRHVIGMNVNIIQHPRGLPKMIAIRNNLLTYRTDRTLLYDTDTDHGSSGAPVFNDSWDVVALHHWGEPFLEKAGDDGHRFPVTVNEGVRISAIYRDLQARRASLPPAQQALLDDVLSYANRIETVVPTLSPPRPRPRDAESADLQVVTGPPEAIAATASQNEVRIVLPIEIVVRVGGVPQIAGVAPAAPRTLTAAAESVRIDDDYSNRDGYNPKFIRGENIPLPKPKPGSKLEKQIAPLRPEEHNAAQGELKYQHFSVKLHKGKRLAMFTATNIDGKRYLDVDRTAGQVVKSEGADRWFKDPRISESFATGQAFYDTWANYFDRGHLTRRSDSTWGTEEEAERANADTFHWTNCSPQHFRFNESANFWQGAERYVLENGVLVADERKRITVFQGPIFDDTIDHSAGDLQIPSSFFKVIVWKGAHRLKAVGLVVDQLALLSEQRNAAGKAKDDQPVRVSHWRVSIRQIEKRTGLVFADAVRAADTIAASAPAVGAEAIIPVNSFEDILR